MAKFDPAPVDKLAEDTKTAIRKDQRQSEHDKAIADTFPASDPVSAQQPVVVRDGERGPGKASEQD